MKKHELVKLLLLPLFATMLLLTSACNDDDPEPVNEEEVITTVRLTFVPVGGGATVVANWKDMDGDGGNPPTVDNIQLKANTVYDLTVKFLNELETPAEDITEEIEEEADEHQIFFQYTGTNMTIAYNDADKDGKPLGLKNKATTTTAGSGALTVTLRHEPNKNAAGVASGNIANAGGETDIITVPAFSVTVAP